MSTSLLYHAFGVRGYRYVRTDYYEGQVAFTIEQPRETCCCSACGSRNVIRHGETLRPFRTLPVACKPVWLVLAIPRLGCNDWAAWYVRRKWPLPTVAAPTPGPLPATCWSCRA